MKITMAKMSAMMFLEFFIWGAWFVTLGTYLGSGELHASGTQIAQAYLSQSIGAIIAPFFVGLIADRYFSAQKILAFLHLAGAVVLWFVAQATSFPVFLGLIILYMVLYMPTLALVNSIAMRHMADPAKQFPQIRVFGSIGWIVAGLLIAAFSWERAHLLQLTFRLAVGASVLLAVYAWTLPDTPPLKRGENTSVKELLGWDAISLLANRSFAVFFIASIAICIPLAFYYNFTNAFLNDLGVPGAAGLQSLGQVSEVLMMLAMPLLFVRMGVKTMLGVAMAAWVLRYVCFAYGNVDSGYVLLIIGIVLHGVCYDFFFVAGQIYTDRYAGERFRSAAQGFITLATYGIGMLIGTLISGYTVDRLSNGQQHHWMAIWWVPASAAAVILVAFLTFFRDRDKHSDVRNPVAGAIT